MSSTPPERHDPPAAAVLLTQAAAADGLAALCALNGVAVDAVPTPIGAVAVCRSAGEEEAERAAATVSRVLRGTPVVLLEQRDGQMTAERWTAGEQGEELSAALMLDGAPAVVEQLLLGQARVADLDGVVSSVGLSRWRAARLLARSARARRR